jgi:SsrA-binding protein
VPLRLYFNERGRAKIEIARGKTLHDKRKTERKRSWEREKGPLLRVKG